MSEFLADETGSVRWLCFNIKSINWKYNTDIDINDVWAQAHSLYKSNEFEYALTSDEIKENEIRNHKFQLLTTEDELIPKYFRVPEKEYEGQFMTATDILLYLQAFTGNLKLNKIMIGKALVKNSFKRIKDSKTERYGFLVHHTMQ
jgi:predicted P-loop ATPase